MGGGSNTDNKNIHAGHRERVRENVTTNGYSQLEDHRLLELLLFYSIPRGDTNEIAHNLIEECGSLYNVLKADPEKLKRVKGIGDNSTVFIGALNELYERLSGEGCDGKTTYGKTFELSRLARCKFRNLNVEQIHLYCFDKAMHLLKTFLITEGDFNSVEIDLKLITTSAISVDASFVAIMHNHPHSSELPSVSDIDATRQISVHLRKMGILLADHIIIGQTGKCYSFKSDKRYENFLF